VSWEPRIRRSAFVQASETELGEGQGTKEAYLVDRQSKMGAQAGGTEHGRQYPYRKVDGVEASRPETGIVSQES
jgi:hypothetical protein